MVINDFDDLYIVSDTQNRNIKLNTLIKYRMLYIWMIFTIIQIVDRQRLEEYNFFFTKFFNVMFCLLSVI